MSSETIIGLASVVWSAPRDGRVRGALRPCAEHSECGIAGRRCNAQFNSVHRRLPENAAGPPPENDKSRKPRGSRDLRDSRGGTRTHDPGILSAVAPGDAPRARATTRRRRGPKLIKYHRLYCQESCQATARPATTSLGDEQTSSHPNGAVVYRPSTAGRPVSLRGVVHDHECYDCQSKNVDKNETRGCHATRFSDGRSLTDRCVCLLNEGPREGHDRFRRSRRRGGCGCDVCARWNRRCTVARQRRPCQAWTRRVGWSNGGWRRDRPRRQTTRARSPRSPRQVRSRHGGSSAAR